MTWGRNDRGQLGLGDTTDRNSTVQLPDPMGSVTAGSEHTCAIGTGTGVLYCWGANQVGQLGLGAPTGDQLVRTVVGSDVDWQQVWAGSNETCAKKTDGRFFCWGQNQSGQLGLGHTVGRSHPTQVCLGP